MRGPPLERLLSSEVSVSVSRRNYHILLASQLHRAPTMPSLVKDNDVDVPLSKLSAYYVPHSKQGTAF